MTRETEPRAESSNTLPERICAVCHTAYTDDARHVTTDRHLEAMADESVREWLAFDPASPISMGFAKQIARLEFFYGDYSAWCAAMGLPDDAATLLINRRLAAIWIRAIAEPDFEQRLAYARKVIELEHGGRDDER